MDFLDRLDPDVSCKILRHLEDASDFASLSCVSRSWRRFVIDYGLWKQLCMRMFPQLSRVARTIELNNSREKEPAEVGSSYPMEWESLERDDRVYALLAQYCTSFLIGDCISEAISASSTDNLPDESVENTLQPTDIVEGRASYWSSKGQSNPAVPETLTYKLVSELCVVTEINIRPFKVYFHLGSPVYSAKSVRFRMGHPRSLEDVGSGPHCHSCPASDDKYIWTYTSQEFPMAQECMLQKFKLPEPVLCVGGILQIELLGRVQRCEIDGLFYIWAGCATFSLSKLECDILLVLQTIFKTESCMVPSLMHFIANCNISYVQVVGRPLSPAFGVEILEPSGKFVLKNDTKYRFHNQPRLPENEPGEMSVDYVQRHLMGSRQIMNLLRGNVIEDVDENE